ncbi:MAG: plasmid pRiA4b ORF-3 family protein [Nanoarchaeota archaeon]
MTKILQLKIVLDGITPKIWRRFLVKDNISFDDLHNVIQAVMGWENYHLSTRSSITIPIGNNLNFRIFQKRK